MPPIRSSTFKYYALLIISISLDREIINPYFRYIKKGLVCIIIISLFSCQPFFCSKCTKANIYLLYDVRLVPFNKYKFLYYAYYYAY